MRANTTSAFTESGFPSSNVHPISKRRHRAIVQEPEATWREAVIERLNELVGPQQGWNVYRGKPVLFHNAHFALSMLDSICPENVLPPQIVPGSGGDLQVEWHTHDEDIELHIRGPNRVTAWRFVRGGDPDGEELELSRDFNPVVTWIENMEEKLAPITAAA